MPPSNTPQSHARLVSGLSQSHPTAFDITPDGGLRREIAMELGFTEIRKFRFTGEIVAKGKTDWALSGELGATIVQPCVVTLEPVVTRIDVPVRRHYVRHWDESMESGAETEMPEDDSMEPLGTHIDPFAVMLEALALAAPDFPRRADAEAMDAVVVTEPGKTALTDEDVKPFAGLAALKSKLEGGSGGT